MKWISHVAIAASICAVCNPAAVPAAILGSTAPDWFEWILNAARQRKVKHRGVTHYLAAWVLAMLAAVLIWDWRGLLFWFAAGGTVHWVCDALTVSGAPLGWWSDRRTTLLGGRVRTGSVLEYVITGAVVLICAVIIWTRRPDQGFLPYFMDWAGLYRSGIVDAAEWRAHRWEIF